MQRRGNEYAFPTRIEKVRKSIGKNFEILATLGKATDIGIGLRAGANLEVIPSKLWTQSKLF